MLDLRVFLLSSWGHCCDVFNEPVFGVCFVVSSHPTKPEEDDRAEVEGGGPTLRGQVCDAVS